MAQPIRWVVEHEFDYEPTYVTPDAGPEAEDDECCVRLGTAIPWEKRLTLAGIIRDFLNDEIIPETPHRTGYAGILTEILQYIRMRRSPRNYVSIAEATRVVCAKRGVCVRCKGTKMVHAMAPEIGFVTCPKCKGTGMYT